MGDAADALRQAEAAAARVIAVVAEKQEVSNRLAQVRAASLESRACGTASGDARELHPFHLAPPSMT
eukprot:5334155-Prymnesium_polylepis.1